VLVLENVTKAYPTRAGQVRALHDVSLKIDPGEFVTVCGPSGSGKTTLLMVIAAMLRPTGGAVRFDGREIYGMAGPERARFRASHIGFVFQMFHLVPYLNVLENVRVAGGALGRKDYKARAEALLHRLGLERRIGHRPAELSAGEKQRVAIARALLNEPRLILADEPTGNLDPENAHSVLTHLRDFQRAGGTVIVATHGPAAGQFATRAIHLREGMLEEVG
jgi:ABC-type lipoprotein export system ATPase subunit